jgi:hypothetical protein
MSYDLTFMPKRPDQTWDDVLDAVESDEDGAGDTPDSTSWQQILTGARTILGNVAADAGDDCFQLTDERTGIQVDLYATSAGVTSPYWYRGAEAATIARTLYALGAIVEAATGFAGYDAQLELPLADAALRPELAVACFDQVAQSFADRGISSPSAGA